MKIFIHIINCFLLMYLAVAAAAKPVLHCLTADYAPFASSKMPQQGPHAVLLKEALATQGYEVNIDFITWARAVETVKNGDADALVDAYWDVERIKWAYYSVPLGRTQLGFFKRIDTPITFSGNLQDLRTHQIGIGRGMAHTKEFDSADYLQKVLFKDHLQGARMLLAGRVDLIVDSREVQFAQKIQGYSDLKKEIEFLQPPLETHYLHMAVSKKTPNAAAKLRAINTGLFLLMVNGRYHDIMAKFKLEI